jgi:hypothetical protein
MTTAIGLICGTCVVLAIVAHDAWRRWLARDGSVSRGLSEHAKVTDARLEALESEVSFLKGRR